MSDMTVKVRDGQARSRGGRGLLVGSGYGDSDCVSGIRGLAPVTMHKMAGLRDARVRAPGSKQGN